MRETFFSAQPFPHFVLDDLWPAPVLRHAAAEFDGISAANWVHYDGPDEQGKCAYNGPMPPASSLIVTLLTSQAAADLLGAITGIEGLRGDPSLYGGGLHRTVPGGFLGLHLDSERHPLTGFLRRLNLIVYLTDEWQPDWGGELEFWDGDRMAAAKKILPQFGRTVIFETSNHSYHGQTRPLACPRGISRKSIAVYYWSEARPRARFVSAAGDKFDAELELRRRERSRVRV